MNKLKNKNILTNIKKSKYYIVTFLLLLAIILIFIFSNSNYEEIRSYNLEEFGIKGYYLQLNNLLDRPQDGYCLDVLGSGQYIRFDMPLTTHNCKMDSFYSDENILFRDDGTIYFPDFNGCVTVMGTNDKALPYNSLMLKTCGEVSPFLNGPNFQSFYFNERNQIQLENSNLCISVGNKAHTTYSLEHKWRSLYMQECSKIDLKYSQWIILPIK